MPSPSSMSFFFFFNDTATTEIYTLSLHDALPICLCSRGWYVDGKDARAGRDHPRRYRRSEEHTSELQSRLHLVCRLLLEKKKKQLKERAGIEDRPADHMKLEAEAVWRRPHEG